MTFYRKIHFSHGSFLPRFFCCVYSLFFFITKVFYTIIKQRWKIKIWPFTLIPPPQSVGKKREDQSPVPADEISSQPGNDSWEHALKKANFPEKLKRILAYNVAGKLKGKINDPGTLLAIQTGGRWLEEYLAEWLPRKPTIIFVEKEIHQDHVREYKEISVKRVEKTINLFIAYHDIDKISGEVIVVDDFIRSGETVRNIVEQLKSINKTARAVATICVTKNNLENIQDDLRSHEMALVYLMTSEGRLL
jgi:hypoxanthine phosphoribosyltransferase